MSFKQIVWKMAKANYKKYIFYYLCNSFAVMFFFIFSTVLFNKHVASEISKEYGAEPLKALLTIPGAALMVFTIFFISYAHRLFTKRRKSEFALFMTLGMSQRDIGKLLLIENMFIAFVSILSGVVAGIVFSRLSFLLLMKAIGIEDISFHLSGNMFYYTIVAFLIVFCIAVGKSLYSVLKDDLVSILKSDQVADAMKWKSPLIGAIGLAVVIVSILGLYYSFSMIENGDGYLFLWTLATFLGIYLFIYQFTSFFIELAKRNKSYYYRRMLLLTNLDYKFKQLTSVCMLIVVLIMITILYNTINLYTFVAIEKDAINVHPYDIAFIQTEDKNNIDRDVLYEIAQQHDNRIQEHIVIPIYSYFERKTSENESWVEIHNFMSLEQFKQLTNHEVELKGNEYLYYISTKSDNEDLEQYGKEFYQYNGPHSMENMLSLTLKDIFVGYDMNTFAIGYDYIVVNDSQLEVIKNSLDGFEENIHLINVANWKESSRLVKTLSEVMKKYNESTPAINDIRTEYYTEEELFYFESKIQFYESLKNSHGLYFYIMSIFSVLFFLGSFTILYLNLFSDMENEKVKFHKLHRIGMTMKEMKRIMAKELAILFFVPSTIGTVIAFLYILIMSIDIGGVMKNLSILLFFISITGIYNLIQLAFYLYAKRKMYLSLMD